MIFIEAWVLKKGTVLIRYCFYKVRFLKGLVFGHCTHSYNKNKSIQDYMAQCRTPIPI